MNNYFVSYSWSTFLRRGVGMCLLETDKNMDTVDGLLDIKSNIEEEQHFKKVVILNYKKLGESDV